jgi:hypothetical protein
MLKTVRVFDDEGKSVEFADVRRVERLASGQLRLEQCLDAAAPAGAVRGVLLPAGSTYDVTVAPSM